MRRLAACSVSSEKYPRATPAWFVTITAAIPARLSRRTAAAVRGSKRIRLGWFT